jgi:hypothetical protein
LTRCWDEIEEISEGVYTDLNNGYHGHFKC